jgi:hypothetical protein
MNCCTQGDGDRMHQVLLNAALACVRYKGLGRI